MKRKPYSLYRRSRDTVLTIAAAYVGLLSLLGAGLAGSFASERGRDVLLVAATAGVTAGVLVPILNFLTGSRLAEIQDFLDVHRAGITDVKVTPSAGPGRGLLEILNELQPTETARIALQARLRPQSLELIRWVTETVARHQTAVLLPEAADEPLEPGSPKITAERLRSEIQGWGQQRDVSARVAINAPAVSFVITDSDLIVFLDPMESGSSPSIVMKASRHSELWTAFDRVFLDAWDDAKPIEALPQHS